LFAIKTQLQVTGKGQIKDNLDIIYSDDDVKLICPTGCLPYMYQVECRMDHTQIH
jgi:hypothetical protein